jgi:hypothetical protein
MKRVLPGIQPFTFFITVFLVAESGTLAAGVPSDKFQPGAAVRGRDSIQSACLCLMRRMGCCGRSAAPLSNVAVRMQRTDI